ncbi:MAG: DUF2610 domain-containing protein [Alsobacter sp.]
MTLIRGRAEALGLLLLRWTGRATLLLVVAACATAFAGSAGAQTRKAFVVGVERYSDANIPRLSRAVDDANDIAADLVQVGFDKKDITVANDLKTKADFNKKFDDFLKTVKEGDIVFFYFSGHGLGVQLANTNYILFGETKSLFSFTKGKLSDDDRKNPDVIRLRMQSFADAYETDEIAANGVSANEIIQKIADKKPRTAFLILDACRSLVAADPLDGKRVKRGPDSGSRLFPNTDLPVGFMVLYSASFGEQAVERFDASDRRRNSLFTEVVRSEMPRPGQTLVDFADRVRLMVRAIANNGGQQQEPEYVENLKGSLDFMFVDSVGAERFRVQVTDCEGAKADWDNLVQLPKRDLVERHRRRFESCPTAEQARRLLVTLSETADEPLALPAVGANRQIDDCDRFAASENDRARPPEIPGVPFDKIDSDEARKACRIAVERNPRIVRFLFNLGRAEHAAANRMRADDPDRPETLRRARIALDDAAKRGYVAALHNLAILYDYGDGPEGDQSKANDLLKRAAQQGFPLAMYNLGLRYQSGERGIQRDVFQAYEWLAKAAESGFIAAMVEVGDALWLGMGVNRNPRRAIEWYQRAAETGSNRAKLMLGMRYYLGYVIRDATGEPTPNSVPRDYSLALLWFGRAAESGDPAAQHFLAYIMENGLGLPNPQPEIAERYYRLSAYGGNEDAEVEFAEKLRVGKVLVKPENGAKEGIALLQRALSQGSTRAALMLAQIYRRGDFDEQKSPIEAMRYAFRTIRLSTEADPTTPDGNPFYEIAAGIMLAEMARSGEAVDAGGQPLLSKDETERLERFYGKIDPVAKQVKVRRLSVPLGCGGYQTYRFIWVWDWGRLESPTEAQFRSLERETRCSDNALLRETLVASFLTARKNSVPFADLIDQQIRSAKATTVSVETRKKKR